MGWFEKWLAMPELDVDAARATARRNWNRFIVGTIFFFTASAAMFVAIWLDVRDGNRGDLGSFPLLLFIIALYCGLAYTQAELARERYRALRIRTRD